MQAQNVAGLPIIAKLPMRKIQRALRTSPMVGRTRLPVLFFFVLVIVLVASVAVCTRASAASPPPVAVTWAAETEGSPIKASVDQLLMDCAAHLGQKITSYPPDVDLSISESLQAGTLVLSFGNTATTRALIGAEELAAVGSEGYIVKSRQLRVDVIATDGNPLSSSNAPGFGFGGNNGRNYGTYALLCELGFAFLHPLQTLRPGALTLPSASINVVERPRWYIRGTHYHSEHPLEWTAVLNGFGDNMKIDEASWRVRLPEVEQLFQWLVAGRQNRMEYIILWAVEWNEFAISMERQQRLQYLTTRAHLWGVALGADVAIAERQQHAWWMVESMRGTLEQQIAEIKIRLTWLFDAGFDFLSTESGTTEFTHPNDVTMLTWINATAEVTSSFENKKAYIKCHCSSGQTCPHYNDPRTGDPLNFNFLPIYSDARMGILPHTVQIYDFMEPSFTYGNENFTFMFDFLKYEAAKGDREVVYHGETAYWVSYDVDVPLFLPIYADARLRDLTMIAQWELNSKSEKKMAGSMNFHSGLEWGYWLNDVMNFDASWDPLTASLEGRLRKWFGDEHGGSLAGILNEMIIKERELLIYGNYSGTPPASVKKRSGQGLLEGWDFPTEIAVLFNPAAIVQPDRLGPLEARDPLIKPNYKDEIEPLLSTMETVFGDLAERMTELAAAPSAPPAFSEFVDCMNITALRAAEVHALWDYAASWDSKSPAWREQRKKDADSVLASAAAVVERRERSYRVSAEYIGAWRPDNPTVYDYGYLWPVHSLFFWWRDYGKATLACDEVLTPCYLNLYNIEDVAIGGIPGGVNISEFVRQVFDDFKWPVRYLTDCLSAPEREYVFPEDLVQ